MLDAIAALQLRFCFFYFKVSGNRYRTACHVEGYSWVAAGRGGPQIPNGTDEKAGKDGANYPQTDPNHHDLSPSVNWNIDEGPQVHAWEAHLGGVGGEAVGYLATNLVPNTGVNDLRSGG